MIGASESNLFEEPTMALAARAVAGDAIRVDADAFDGQTVALKPGALHLREHAGVFAEGRPKGAWSDLPKDAHGLPTRQGLEHPNVGLAGFFVDQVAKSENGKA
jgi:hypothetical protein